MKIVESFFVRLAVPAFFAASAAVWSTAQAAPTDEEIANGLDPVTTGQAAGNYPGGNLLAGEYFPTLADHAFAATEEEIANGLDPLTTGQVIGNYSGGAALPGEYLPYEQTVRVAKRKE